MKRVVGVTERFDGTSKWPPWAYFQHVERYKWASQFAPHLTVLDAACGSGFGTRLLLDSGAKTVTSVDVDEHAVALTRSRPPEAHTEIGNVEDLRLPSGIIGLYVSFETLEHVSDPRKMLAEADRVLAPHGQLIISTPNRRLHTPPPRLPQTP